MNTFRCGGEAVVCYWPGLIILVSRQSEGDTISFSYDTPLFLAQELDCVRIITNHQHEILQKVLSIIYKYFVNCYILNYI